MRKDYLKKRVNRLNREVDTITLQILELAGVGKRKLEEAKSLLEDELLRQRLAERRRNDWKGDEPPVVIPGAEIAEEVKRVQG